VYPIGSDEFSVLISKPGRKLLVVLNELDGGAFVDNTVFVIEVQEAAGAAGGRAAGMGLRKPVRVHGFRFEGRVVTKFFETPNESEVELFELPYHATAMDVVLPDGSQRVVNGVVDFDLANAYEQVVKQIRSTTNR